jgi:hypothetical protein
LSPVDSVPGHISTFENSTSYIRFALYIGFLVQCGVSRAGTCLSLSAVNQQSWLKSRWQGFPVRLNGDEFWPLCAGLNNMLRCRFFSWIEWVHSCRVKTRRLEYDESNIRPTRGLAILVARLTARDHKRIFSLCHYFARTKPLWQNETCYLGQNEWRD